MIRPLGKRILVIKVQEETTKSGIILAQKEENNQRAKVVALGDVSELSVGDTVIVKLQVGVEVEEDGKKYQIIDLEDVLAVVE